MLVLTRQPEEEIIISFKGKRVKIKVLSVDNRKVSLGFEADLEVSILRSELQANEKTSPAEAAINAK